MNMQKEVQLLSKLIVLEFHPEKVADKKLKDCFKRLEQRFNKQELIQKCGICYEYKTELLAMWGNYTLEQLGVADRYFFKYKFNSLPKTLFYGRIPS